MNIVSKERYLKMVEEKLVAARKYLADLEQSRNEAPSAMESQHDTTRETLEREMGAQEEVIKNLEQFHSFLQTSEEKSQIEEGAEFTIDLGDAGSKIERAIYAPLSVGLEGVTIITAKSPLGAAIYKKKTQEDFTYQIGDQQIHGKIEQIS